MIYLLLTLNMGGEWILVVPTRGEFLNIWGDELK